MQQEHVVTRVAWSLFIVNEPLAVKRIPRSFQFAHHVLSCTASFSCKSIAESLVPARTLCRYRESSPSPCQRTATLLSVRWLRPQHVGAAVPMARRALFLQQSGGCELQHPIQSAARSCPFLPLPSLPTHYLRSHIHTDGVDFQLYNYIDINNPLVANASRWSVGARANVTTSTIVNLLV